MKPGRGRMHRFRIPLRKARFELVDLGYTRPLVGELAGRALVFNGGYWAYDARGGRRIQGLLIVNDQRVADRAGLRGGVLEVKGDAARLMETKDYRPSAEGVRLAVQCSPRLVSGGKPVSGLRAQRRAARTALCIGADRHFLDVYLSEQGAHSTLRELSAFLLAQGCQEALNLDGGPSTAAVARTQAEPLMIGVGVELPYGIGVRFDR